MMNIKMFGGGVALCRFAEPSKQMSKTVARTILTQNVFNPCLSLRRYSTPPGCSYYLIS